MKKILSVFLTVLLILTNLAACASNKKSEEDLRAEIKAELEAEKIKETKLREEVKADMKDMNALYEFVKKEIVDITKKNFDTWEVYYSDITEDGSDDAVLVSTYGADWYDKMEIISGDSGEYKRILSDIPLAKYGNVVEFKDGFLAVIGHSGGPGAQYYNMSLYIYDGSKMITSLNNLLMTEEVSAPSASYKKTGEIDGKLTNFVYTLTKYDNNTEKETIEKKEQYIYNANTMKFDVKPMKVQSVSGSQQSSNQSAQNDISQGYTYKVEEGTLKLTYNNTGNTVTLIKPNEQKYEFTKSDGPGMMATYPIGFPNVLYANKSHDGARLYFTVEPTLGSFPVTFYFDMNTMRIYWVYEGDFVRDISEVPYTNYIILRRTFSDGTHFEVYDDHNLKACDLGNQLEQDVISQITQHIQGQNSGDNTAGMEESEHLKLSGFSNETLYGVKVNYNDYTSVIVPKYNGKNNSSLTGVTKVIGSVTQGAQGMRGNFAIFGHLEDITITYYHGMESNGETLDAGTLYNANVDIQIYVPMDGPPSGDMSCITVTGKAPTGSGDYREIQFTLDDMRDLTADDLILLK